MRVIDPDLDFDLVFEISEGCEMSCQGCQVDKAEKRFPSDDELIKLYQFLLDLKNNGLRVSQFELGPTDIISSTNYDEIFNNSLIKTIYKLFGTITVNITLTHLDENRYIKLAEDLIRSFPGVSFGTNTPIEIRHMFNKKYLDRLKRNSEVFYNHLTKLNGVFNGALVGVIVDTNYMKMKRYKYEDLFSVAMELNLFPNTGIDFAFHHGRRPLNSYTRELLRDSLMELHKNYLIDLEKRDFFDYRYLPSLINLENEDLELTYRQGDIFIRPSINERVTIFEESWRLEDDWSYDSLVRLYNKVTDLTLVKGKPCEVCEWKERCSSRYIPLLMESLDTNDCLGRMHELVDLFKRKKIPFIERKKYYDTPEY